MQGSLSLGRMDSIYVQDLVHYLNSTSWLCVTAVCSLTLFPAFAITLLVEMLPLRPPSAGWEANWMYWIRLYLSTFVMAIGAAVQIKTLVPASLLTWKHVWFIAFGASTGLELCNLLLAWLWRFPIPFAFLVGSSLWTIAILVIALMIPAIGLKRWRENPSFMKQMKLSLSFFSSAGATHARVLSLHCDLRTNTRPRSIRVHSCASNY